MILLAGTRHTCQMVGLQWALQKRNSENAKKGKTFSRSHNRILKFLKISIWLDWASPCGSAGKESACNAGDLGSIPASGRYPGEGKGYLLQYSGLENSRDYIAHGEGNGTPLQYSCLENPMDWRSLVGCSPWRRWESDTTEWLHFHFSLSCIGEENDNPLQCSCLENPRDGGALWAAVYGVAGSRTLLKWLSSSI